ncbi:MAG TPA: amidase family protein [Gemmatimonadaceae bacterium]
MHLYRRVALAATFLASTALAQTPRAITVDVNEATVTDLQRAMAEGRVTSVELVDAYLARITAYDHRGPAINAMIRLNPRARADAAKLDAERKAGHVRGPLHGIPILLKDNFDTKDMITSAGSLALATNQPSADAFVIAKLRDAGAVFIGKSNMQEFAAGVTSVSSLGGQTRNPYDLARYPGGSSGGTGAAIAASFATLGWGSDACGSIRLPSAFASLFGLRPSMGLFSRDGIVPIAHSQDVPGPMARTVMDLAIGLDATVGRDAHDPATSVLQSRTAPHFVDALRRDALRGAHIGIFVPYLRNGDADVVDTVRSAAQSLRALGATVVDVNMPDFDDVIAGSSMAALEMKFDLAEYLARPGKPPVHSLREIIDDGLFEKGQEPRYVMIDTASARDSEAHRKVTARQAFVRARITALMDSLGLDALAYPTSVRKPALIGDPQLGVNCALSAQTGLPAITMPAGFTADGLPTGLELMGHAFSDAQLVAFAYAYEQAGSRRHPPYATPALVRGHAPQPIAWSIANDVVDARMSFDAVLSEVTFDVRARARYAPGVQAIVLRRSDDKRSRVVERLSGPGYASASGRVRLLGIDRDALLAGRMTLAIFTSEHVLPAAEIKLSVP